MAIGRMSVKVGKAGKAGPHSSYIAREGQYADRLERGEKLEAKQAGNMPAWAQANPQEFWRAADAYERKNGSTYREMEIALPREMTPDQRRELVQDFVRQEIGEKYPYQWAIHTPTASDGKEQPHVHLMFNERRLDGIERDPEQHFKRYNAQHPERGGAQKDNTGKDAGQRRQELVELRGRWEAICNAHLERAGLDARIDMRSHAERQTGLVPERKQLPSEWRDLAARAQVIEFREARRELVSAGENLRREIPDAGAEIVSLQAERERRQKPPERLIDQLRREVRERPAAPLLSGAEALARARAEVQGPAKQQTVQEMLAERGDTAKQQGPAKQQTVQEMLAERGFDQAAQKAPEAPQQLTRAEAFAESRRLKEAAAKARPEPLEAAVMKSPEVVAAGERVHELASRGSVAWTTLEQARAEVEQWRQDHPIKAKAHDAGWRQSDYLTERERTIERAEQAHRETIPLFEEAKAERARIIEQARERIEVEQRPAHERADQLEQQAAAMTALSQELAVKHAATLRRGMDYSDDARRDDPGHDWEM